MYDFITFSNIIRVQVGISCINLLYSDFETRICDFMNSPQGKFINYNHSIPEMAIIRTDAALFVLIHHGHYPELSENLW